MLCLPFTILRFNPVFERCRYDRITSHYSGHKQFHLLVTISEFEKNLQEENRPFFFLNKRKRHNSTKPDNRPFILLVSPEVPLSAYPLSTVYYYQDS